jgi:transcriptional regulator with XRE-family HTH domain
MIGERIRETRIARQMSLSDVAVKAHVSTATLSRIETGKQTIDVTLLMLLARILRVPSADLLGTEEGQEDSVADQIASLKPSDRVRLWRELSTTQKDHARQQMSDVAQQLEELVAQIDFIRGQVDHLRAAVRNGTGSRRRG